MSSRSDRTLPDKNRDDRGFPVCLRRGCLTITTDTPVEAGRYCNIKFRPHGVFRDPFVHNARYLEGVDVKRGGGRREDRPRSERKRRFEQRVVHPTNRGAPARSPAWRDAQMPEFSLFVSVLSFSMCPLARSHYRDTKRFNVAYAIRPRRRRETKRDGKKRKKMLVAGHFYGRRGERSFGRFLAFREIAMIFSILFGSEKKTFKCPNNNDCVNVLLYLKNMFKNHLLFCSSINQGHTLYIINIYIITPSVYTYMKITMFDFVS